MCVISGHPPLFLTLESAMSGCGKLSPLRGGFTRAYGTLVPFAGIPASELAVYCQASRRDALTSLRVLEKRTDPHKGGRNSRRREC